MSLDADAKPGVDLRQCEALRRFVWEQCPETRRSDDYDHVTKSYPADPSGACRHKVEYLRQHLGGVMLTGRRLDGGPKPGLHAALAVRVGGHLVVLDVDGIWPWKGYRKRWKPELHQPAPPPAPPPPPPPPKPAPARGGWYSRKG